jgi:hypothetical protein
MASCCKFYSEMLVYTKREKFVDVSNDFHFYETEFEK